MTYIFATKKQTSGVVGTKQRTRAITTTLSTTQAINMFKIQIKYSDRDEQLNTHVEKTQKDGTSSSIKIIIIN